MLLFMLSSGLTLIFGMMGVLNFAHAGFYMLGAYFAYTLTGYLGFWTGLLAAPVLVGGRGGLVGEPDGDRRRVRAQLQHAARPGRDALLRPRRLLRPRGLHRRARPQPGGEGRRLAGGAVPAARGRGRGALARRAP